ncbi:MAG TPA: hypothetical protein VGM05_10550 [Planctomycetaceae bacterium]|jgi:hypothetical protein
MPESTAALPVSNRSSSVIAVLRNLYTNNPFYLVSAGLILYGLHVSFRPEAGQLINPWALMGLLCGYAVILAATAYLMIRYGKVWEDARSIVLVLLLIIVAISVSFDEMINTSPAQGYGLLLFGLAFSTAISEALFRGLSIRLSWLFRCPFYAILFLFFIYPLFVSQEVTELPRATVDLRIYLFSSVAGGVFLTLIPAIRRGAGLVGENGTPWRWPWFPWTAFGFLAVGVVLRSYGLSLAFSPADGMESTFGVYYLVPFFLALLVLALEIGIVEQREVLTTITLWLAPALVLLSIPMDEGSVPYRNFLGLLTSSAASPLYLSVIGLLMFYAYAWARGARQAEWGVALALLLACVVGRQTVSPATLESVHWWPLAVLDCIELWQAIVRRNSVRSFVAVTCVLASLSIGLQGTTFMAYGGAVPLHLEVAAALAIGVVFHDPFALFLRRTCAVLLPLACLTAVDSEQSRSLPEALWMGYLFALTCVAIGYWRLAGDRWFLFAGGINAACSLLSGAWSLHGTWSRSVGARGFGPLVWGTLSFGLAVLISAHKARLFRRVTGTSPDHATRGEPGGG